MAPLTRILVPLNPEEVRLEYGRFYLDVTAHGATALIHRLEDGRRQLPRSRATPRFTVIDSQRETA